jgi:hypothetical protein
MNVGDKNQNDQELIRRTATPSGTHPFARVWEMECGRCGHRYGCNSCDAHIRHCPQAHEGGHGQPGEAI